MQDPPIDPRSFHVPAAAVPADPETPPPAGPGPGPRARPKRRRRRWVVLGLLLIALVPLVLTLAAWWTWRGVDRVDVAGVTMGNEGGTTNYLVVGTDSREGVDADVENAGFIFGSEGERTDTIAVLQVEGDDVRLLAIPRDLWVTVNGDSARINAAFASGGPEALIQVVQQELGIGIDHYLEIDFAGFLSLVDALGGVTIDVPHPAFDPNSGLLLEEGGPNELDADQALAYVRSRTYTEIIDGSEQVDVRSDIGRVERQQRFLAAVFAELGDTKNPITLLRALDGVAENVRVDDDLGLRRVMSLGLTIRGATPETFTLPTTRFITPGGADVLLLDEPAAAPVLELFS